MSAVAVVDALAGGELESTLAADVLDGLTRDFKELPPKHFYDHAGSLLFDRICELPEYYPTRAERSILERYAAEIVAVTGATELVELGSGVPTKTRVLLDAMRSAGTLDRYLPFDVSGEVLRESASGLVDDYPGLRVHGVVGDFDHHLQAVPPPEGRRLVAFLGGTIGNLVPARRVAFLRDAGALLGSRGALLLGTDLVKDVAVLEAAYNDSAGVTAAFNRNVLAVINRELGADFDLAAFEHVAFFDREHEWIEMRLRSVAEQTVHVRALGLDVRFAAGEEMRTEISAKFTRARVERELGEAGLELERWLTVDEGGFALSLCRLCDTTVTGT